MTIFFAIKENSGELFEYFCGFSLRTSMGEYDLIPRTKKVFHEDRVDYKYDSTEGQVKFSPPNSSLRERDVSGRFYKIDDLYFIKIKELEVYL